MANRNWNLRGGRIVRWAVACVLITLVVSAVVSRRVADRLVAPVPRPIPTPTDLDVEAVSITSDSGSTLSGWYVPGLPDQGTVVLFHGIRSSRLQMVSRARFLNAYGYSALLIDFQAHGESPGQRITAGYLERLDVRAAVRFARNRKPGCPLAVIGASMGGAATLLASPLDIDAAVLEAVYPTISEAIVNRIRMRLGPLSPVAARLLLVQLKPRLGVSPAELCPIEYIREIGCPVMIMAGREDQRTPIEETMRLYRSALSPKRLELFDGAEHVDLFNHDPAQYTESVISFLDNHLTRRDAQRGAAVPIGNAR